jgi:hypothetical protein
MKICPDCSREHKEPKRKKCGACRIKTTRKNMKLRAVEYKGGKCERCDYSKSLRALQFHHLDPNKKDFQISRASNPSWEKVKEELDKCVMLCANCHAEEHEKLDAD